MEEKNEQKTREFRGLYKHVKISVKTLDKIIVACIAVILIVVALDLRNPGFTIPENPTREGYDFSGWYVDYACSDAWDIETDTIETDITLYAGWEEISE